MNKIVIVCLLALVSFMLPTRAQTSSGAQISLCDSLVHAGQYEEAYRMAEALMQHAATLSDEQRQHVGSLYVKSGYEYAEEAANADCYNPAVYQQLRNIMRAITPYASDGDLELISEAIYISLHNEGYLHRKSLRHTEAIACYLEVLAMKYVHETVTDKINDLEDLAYEYKCISNLLQAIDIYTEALAYARENDDLIHQLEILQQLQAIHSIIGDVGQTLTCSNALDSVNARICTMIETVGNTEQKYSYYAKRGAEYEKRRSFKVAEQWYTKALAIAESEVQDGYSPLRFDAYTNLMTLGYLAHDYDAAYSQGLKAIAEHKLKQDPASPLLWMTYLNMTHICRSRGDMEGCKAYVDSLVAISTHMTSADELYQVKTAQAICYESINDYAAALDLYKEADAILAAEYPATHSERMRLLLIIARMTKECGRYDEAERLGHQYAELCREVYGENNRRYQHSLFDLAQFEAHAGHPAEGAGHMAEAFSLMHRHMRQNMPYMSTSEREGFWDSEDKYLSGMTSYAVATGQLQTPFTRASYSQLALSKAFLLASERSLFETIQREGTPADMHDYTTIAVLRAQIKELENDYVANADSILDLSLQIEGLEKGLMERCRTFGSLMAYLDIDYDTVKQHLAPGETLIDFADYNREGTGHSYGAYVINKEQDMPLLQPLFVETDMEALGIEHPDLYYDADYAPSVLRLLWEPLRAHVTEGSTVYYVPSQLLFQISLEALPLTDGSLLGDHYRFVRLSSARELLRPRIAKLDQLDHTAVLYGGLHYDLDPFDMLAEARKYDVANLLALRGEDGEDGDETLRGHTLFRDLPGTREEVAQIGAILTANHWTVTPHTGTQGTEESFLALHGQSPTILQIATHGFYYTPDRVANADYLKGYTDAMMLSGLVLSGGNAAWMGNPLPEGVLGGILTANRIARLDLSGTDMVVLSACQSGAGKATSEGLYGLQRAFKKAGVGTMILSLWNVSDKVTTDFMTTLYAQLAGPCHWDKRQAFNAARTIIREKYPNPYYWAAFVMQD